MYYPIDTATLEHLMERRNQDYPKVSQAVADLEWKRMHPGDTNRNESQSHRGPHRIGREPEPDSPDWALGGREDEDVRDQRTDVTGEVPLTTGGYPITGRGTGMTSIPELSAAVNGARAISAEAAGMLSQVIQAFDDHLHFQEIIEKLQEAVGAHSQIMDGVGSESGSLMAANGKLIAAIAHVEEAQQACGQALMDCAAARQAVSGSHEDDDRFIHGIHSV
jgi:hypothetical protein